MKAERIIDLYLESLTNGMMNAYNKMEGAMKCSDCGLSIPKYKGRYPGKCPECGNELNNITDCAKKKGTPK